jgi:hypothetical protein
LIIENDVSGFINIQNEVVFIYIDFGNSGRDGTLLSTISTQDATLGLSKPINPSCNEGWYDVEAGALVIEESQNGQVLPPLHGPRRNTGLSLQCSAISWM